MTYHSIFREERMTTQTENTRAKSTREKSSKSSGALALRDETWELIREKGKLLATNCERAMSELGDMFASGFSPTLLDSATEGMLVGWSVNPLADKVLSRITGLWLPWVGKRFNRESNTGDNLMTREARFGAKALWPLYKFSDFEGKTAGFSFTTWVEKGKEDPETDVLVIDYASVKSNPRLIIKSIRDELVEVVPGANLGKMLWRSGNGESAKYTLLAYFALKSPID
ncbi:MAG: hypothetical protein HKL80_06875 [Acidimicrobiales bacterium]|nr:hypothetical protein [Acidimicrobiales bacterium]